jgi:7,8-dihydropterin-6-yl-methyl-4-(beta-D-ribofuranosyl)aminobenzene 5'-phosphate synthase
MPAPEITQLDALTLQVVVDKNAALAAQAALPGQPIDVLLGGYHPAGAAVEQRIPATMRDLLDLVQPALSAAGHCSG